MLVARMIARQVVAKPMVGKSLQQGGSSLTDPGMIDIPKYKDDWCPTVFVDSVRMVYNITPPGSHGQSLCATVVNAIIENREDLLSESSLSDVMRDIADLGRDLFQVMAKGTIDLSPLAAAELLTFVCPTCAFEFRAKPCAKDEITCPVCTAAHSGDKWQSGMNVIPEDDLGQGDSDVVIDSWDTWGTSKPTKREGRKT